PHSPRRRNRNELDDRPQTPILTGGDHGHAVRIDAVTDRDDFLREHLSPPSESGEGPASRPPDPPRPAGPDDTSTRNGINEGFRPTGPDGDGPRLADDPLRRPDEPGRPVDDRRPRWTADAGRTPP